ncbi:MAG: protelomerase family protein, partial [Prochloraceae cyanobacterium]
MPRSSKKQERLQRIDRLIASLQNCSDPLKIAQLGTIEHDWLFDNYAASSAGTFISGEYLPAIDLAFEPSEGEELLAHECWQKVNGVLVKRHLVSQSLKPTIQEWNERNQPVKKSTVNRINSKLPLYPKPIIERATELLESNSWAKVAAGLIALTGRRPTEIAWSGNFTPESNYSLIFSGQLKKGAIESQSFSIPTLIEADRILVAFQRLRNLQRNKTKILEIDNIPKATKATNSQINRCVY